MRVVRTSATMGASAALRRRAHRLCGEFRRSRPLIYISPPIWVNNCPRSAPPSAAIHLAKPLQIIVRQMYRVVGGRRPRVGEIASLSSLLRTTLDTPTPALTQTSSVHPLCVIHNQPHRVSTSINNVVSIPHDVNIITIDIYYLGACIVNKMIRKFD